MKIKGQTKCQRPDKEIETVYHEEDRKMDEESVWRSFLKKYNKVQIMVDIS